MISFMSFWSIAHAFKQKPSSFLGYSHGRQISATLVQAASPLVDYSLQEVGVHSKLHKVVRNHALTSSKWTECHTTSSHTIEAMDIAIKFLEAFHSVKNPNVKAPLPVIFDSGCGTGRSSEFIAKQNPHLPVLGLDRSLSRLQRNTFYGANNHERNFDITMNDDGFSSAPYDNMLLLRCDLVDFWFLAQSLVQQGRWLVAKHYILYANPYPRPRQLNLRWHGHPVFPFLLLCHAKEIVLRSSWRTYLEEFATATRVLSSIEVDSEESISMPSAPPTVATRNDMCCQGFGSGSHLVSRIRNAAAAYEVHGPSERDREFKKPTEAWTLFEAKYDNAGQPTYELVLKYKD